MVGWKEVFFLLCWLTLFFNLLFSRCADTTGDSDANLPVFVDREGIFFYFEFLRSCNKMVSYLPYFFIVISDPPYRCYVGRISIL